MGVTIPKENNKNYLNCYFLTWGFNWFCRFW